jgi:hypothetical protein
MRVLTRLKPWPGFPVWQYVPVVRTPTVLVVEASNEFGHGFRQVIGEKLGEHRTVCWIQGVASIKPLIGVDEWGRLVFLSLKRCKIVFIDGQIDGRISGVELAQGLKDHPHLTFVASTMWKEKNLELVASGNPDTIFPILKTALFAALVEGSLTLDDILEAREYPKATRAKLEIQEERLKLDRDFRALAEDIVTEELHRVTGESKK